MIRIWVDDWRAAPSLEWTWCKSVQRTKMFILDCMKDPDWANEIVLISLDHDSGDYQEYGGDYIEILNWLEKEDYDCEHFRFHIHSANSVGVANMRAIIEHNHWREVKYI